MSTYIATADYHIDIPDGEGGQLVIYGGVRGDLVPISDEALGVDGNARYLAAQGLRPLDGGTAEELVRERNAAIAAIRPRSALSDLVKQAVALRAVRGDL